MDSERFDSLTRTLASSRSRRGLTQSLFGVAIGAAAILEGPPAAGAKKKCGPCKKKKKGKCKKKKPNDTPCNGTGKCLNGVCNQPPTCMPAFSPACISGAECCSGVCIPPFPTSTCGLGAAGTPCLSNTDCTSNVCTGFRCQ